MHTLASFRVAFAEFDAVADATVQARLDEAEGEIDATVWGDSATSGHGWLTAHLLTSSSYGKEAPKDGTTTYGRRFEALQRRVGTAYRLVLD